MLSILIVNWNTCDKLRKCLQSLHEHPPQHPHEIIVIDNDSHDGSADMVRGEFPQVICIESGSNLGYAAGNNLAFKTAKGEWLLTLNPDTELLHNTCDIAIHTLACHPECGCLGARLLNFDQTVQKSVRGFPNFFGIAGELTPLARLMPGSIWDSYRLSTFQYESEGYAPQPMGTFLLFKRSALAAIGDPTRPFDEAFPIFFNEVDLLKRLHDFGFLCWYTPQASLFHHHGASTKQKRKSMIWESHKSLVNYFRKHSKGAERLALPLLTIASNLAAFIRAKGYDPGFRP